MTTNIRDVLTKEEIAEVTKKSDARGAPDLPARLGTMIQRCLEKDPGRRFQTVRDVREELSRLREEIRSPASRLSRGLLVSAAVVVAAALLLSADVGGVRSRLFGRATPPVSRDPENISRLAVLPFEDHSPTEGQEWFAAGMHDALLTALQQVKGLRVISMCSCILYYLPMYSIILSYRATCN